MADAPSPSAPVSSPAVERIEAALTRIESAAAKRAFDGERLARRHAALRARIEDAVAALDTLIAHESEDDADADADNNAADDA